MTAVPDLDVLRVGDVLPGCSYTCDNVQLMLFNASLWNGHRIHYDEAYATGVEGYPGLVVAGPLIGDWLAQCVTAWLGECGELLQFGYSNRTACYVGETVTSGGIVTAIDDASREVTIDLGVRNASGDVIAPGTARVRL